MNATIELDVEMLPMNARDISEIQRIEYRVYSHPWSRANFTDSIDSGYCCRVCRLGGELIGYFVLMSVVDEAHLLNIGVDEKRQGAGFGARLLRHAMEVAWRNGAGTLLLEVRPSNERALALYRHFGFRQIGIRRGYYPAVVGREDALVLAHALGEVDA
ncbi:MAG: ribosomal protein S18-alanine N-acetyltransferase [Candidatus Accumulibacter sp.]|jgi:ribosomal-protein-alanine N-acetyltransferase|nr:ribosomal protein S18-alanine N-acetyltransferase [Accumulibacter sp.]